MGVHAQVTGQIEHADESNFDQMVLESQVPVLVDFYADWCGPCRMMVPMLDELAKESTNARVVKVNVDESPQLAVRYGVNSIPNLQVFKDGQVVGQTDHCQETVATRAADDLRHRRDFRPRWRR